jgi:acetoin utilization deacetylase AcuC-like enzyme
MRAYYTDIFVLPLPPDHRFPMDKYARLRDAVSREGLAELLIPDAATDTQLCRVHTTDYVHRFTHGLLTTQEIRRIGFPHSPEMIERARRSAGATIAAARAAFVDAVSVNLAGGTHHACRDHGEGYSCFNDAVVSARAMQDEGRARRVAVIDCDVHQGNGTADCAHGDSSIFTFSIHAERNYPFRKIPSDLDIGLPDGTGDTAYLEALEEAVRRVLAVHNPDLVIYLAGADPFAGDRLGYLKLTLHGLAQRDRFVLSTCRAENIPVAVAMAGGYAPNIDDIVQIHLQTVRLCAEHAHPSAR